MSSTSKQDQYLWLLAGACGAWNNPPRPAAPDTNTQAWYEFLSSCVPARVYRQSVEASRNRHIADLDKYADQLRLECNSLGAVLYMAVSRLGGTVEGRPTARVNFLQRVDELRTIETELSVVRRALEMVVEKSSRELAGFDALISNECDILIEAARKDLAGGKAR